MAKLESSDAEPPDFAEGYDEWKTAFDKGKAGIWKVTVSEIVVVLEEALAK